MTEFLSWEKSWVYVAISSQQQRVWSFPFCWFGCSRPSQVLLDPRDRSRESHLTFPRNTMFTTSLFALSSLFTWISKANYFIRNVLRKQYLFLTPGHLSKSKDKREGREGYFLWGQHLHIWLSPQWEFTAAFLASSMNKSQKGPT